MPAKSTKSTYGTIAVTIHWLSALLIIALLGSGFRAASTADPEAKAQILTVHAPLGIAILVLTVARIAWWWFADRKPASIPDMPAWQDISARAVHLLFYIVILGMAASGIGMFVLSGAGPIIFGGAAGQLPDFQQFLPRIPHGFGARAMVLLLVVHAGAALYHHFVKKDGLLRRMWFRGGKVG
ncbi:MAG: cytochrome b [Rhizobiaceae bacterium]